MARNARGARAERGHAGRAPTRCREEGRVFAEKSARPLPPTHALPRQLAPRWRCHCAESLRALQQGSASAAPPPPPLRPAPCPLRSRSPLHSEESARGNRAPAPHPMHPRAPDGGRRLETPRGGRRTRTKCDAQARGCFEGTDGLIYVCDGQSSAEDARVFEDVLRMPEMREGAPLLVLASKQDLVQRAPAQTVDDARHDARPKVPRVHAARHGRDDHFQRRIVVQRAVLRGRHGVAERAYFVVVQSEV